LKFNVPIRKKEEFQSDDGRRIETLTKKSSVETELPDEAKEQLDNPIADTVYIGVLTIAFIDGVKEKRFYIPDASSLEDAFNKFNGPAAEAIKEVERDAEASEKVSFGREQEEDNKIVTASEMDMDAIRQMQQGS
tara:strand:- start:6166 stop:6570 length:405 start_codon:yes stop_codon:yes gene_type:complete